MGKDILSESKEDFEKNPPQGLDEDSGRVLQNSPEGESIKAIKRGKKKTQAKNKKIEDSGIVKAAKEFQSKKDELASFIAKREEIEARIKQIESDLVSLKETIKGGISDA